MTSPQREEQTPGDADKARQPLGSAEPDNRSHETASPGAEHSVDRSALAGIAYLSACTGMVCVLTWLIARGEMIHLDSMKPSLASAMTVTITFIIICIALIIGIVALIMGLLSLRTIKRSQGELCGRGFAIAGVTVGAINAVFLIFILIFIFFIAPAMIRHRDETIPRVQSDIRSMGVAIEAYQVDNKAYPAWSANTADAVCLPTLVSGGGIVLPVTTFMSPARHPGLGTLTTPVAYMEHYPADPLAPIFGLTFAYYATPPHPSDGGKPGWIVWSAGPDRIYDLNRANIPQICKNTSNGQAWNQIMPYLYDPTNGTDSAGDIVRVSEALLPPQKWFWEK
jgi:uncharacterized membrane protein